MLHKSVGILHATLALRNITPVTTVSFMSQIYTGAARDATVKGFELILIFFFFFLMHSTCTSCTSMSCTHSNGCCCCQNRTYNLVLKQQKREESARAKDVSELLKYASFNAFFDEWAPKKYLQLALWPDHPLMHTLTCSSFYYFLFPVFIWKLNKALSIPKCKHILPIHCSTFSTTEQKRESYCTTKQCSHHCVQLSCQLCCCSCSASSPCATTGKQDTKFQLTSMRSFVSAFTTSCDVGIFELVYLVRDLRHLWWPGVQQCKIVL